jgi:1,4-alpha-glucan branching enzyme
MSLIGDFNNWNTDSHPYASVGFGKWHLKIPANIDGACPVRHGSFLKVAVKKNGVYNNKLSPWANYVTVAKNSIVYHQEFYNPSQRYVLKSPRPKPSKSLRIYE